MNPGQRAAVRLRGNLLVSASAGTGKTTVLVERLVGRVLDPVAPVGLDRLMVVTFTEAAAAQMKAKILAALLELRLARPHDQHLAEQISLLPGADISTLHAWCLRLVRRHFHLLGLDPAVEVMDEHDADLLMRETLDSICDHRYAAGDQAFFDLVDAYGDDRGDEPVRKATLALLRSARTQPDPAGWLRSWSLRLQSGEDQGPWLLELAGMIRDRLALAGHHLAAAAGMAAQADGPGVYLPVLHREQDLVAGLRQEAGRCLDALGSCAAGAAGWEEPWQRLLGRIVAAEKCPRLPGARGVDPDRAEAARKCRNRAWAIVGSLAGSARSWEPADLRSGLARSAGVVAALVDLALDLDRAAREARSRAGRIDFADFEYYALRLLRADPGAGPSFVAGALRERYVEVLVDEYQDINLAQAEILRLVSNGNLFCVGDIKQSIYGFRGVSPEAFRRLGEAYVPADPDASGAPGGGPPSEPPAGVAGRRVVIDHNFRSRPRILDAVNHLFRRLMSAEAAGIQYDDGTHDLLPGAEVYRDAPGPDAPVEVYLLERGVVSGDVELDHPGAGAGQAGEDDPEPEGADLEAIEAEAHLVGRRILGMVGAGGRPAEFWVYDARESRHRPVRFGDIAVLLRAAANRAHRYLEVLSALGVPVEAELSTGYLTAVEVETALSLLRVIDNPRQDVALAAVLRSPMVGLSEQELAAVRCADRAGDYYHAVQVAAGRKAPLAPGPGPGLPDLPGKLNCFLDRLDDWRTAARRGPLSDLVWRLLEETGYLTLASGLPGGAQRQANLLDLYERARDFDRFARQGLPRFLRFVERLGRAERDLGAAGRPGEELDAVRLTTVHQAKGLEFPVVFLPDLGKRFRLSDPANVLWHPGVGIGPMVADRAAGIRYPTVAWSAVHWRRGREALAEEMRILYVACTRARERLVLSGSARNLEAAIQRWTAGEGGRDSSAPACPERVAPEIVANGRSMLDWIGTGLARHPEARRTMLNWGQGTRERDGAADRAGGPGELWSVTCGTPAAVLAAREMGAGEAVAGPPGPGSGRGHEPGRPAAGEGRVAKELRSRLAWAYPHAWRTGIPSRAAATALSRQAATGRVGQGDAGEDLAETAAVLPVALPEAAEEREFALPALHHWGQSKLDGLGRGSAVHLILRLLDLGLDLDRSGIAAQVSRLVSAGRLPPSAGELDQAAWDGLAWFFGTSQGRRLREQRGQVRREVPFSLAVDAVEAWPDRVAAGAGSGEVVLVQGIIDCLLRTGQAVEVLEWKSDRLAPAGVPGAVARYRPQLELYCRAVAAATGWPVSRAVLVFLTPRQVVEVDML